MKLMESLKALGKSTPLHPVYQYIAERRKLREKRRRFWDWSEEDQGRFDFYRQFVNEGDVVFDVGANMGNRSKIFAKLGATIVAVEPQQACARFLLSVFKNRDDFHLEKVALGASVGESEMLVCDVSTISSLSTEWVQSVKKSGRFSELEWNKKQTVSINTLDNLIQRYGHPSFIKIDVEGFEDQVISGLSTPVAALSMEYTPEFMKSIMNCIDHLESIGKWEYQMSLGESMKFTLSDWLEADDIRRRLIEPSATSSVVGDLYARSIKTNV